MPVKILLRYTFILLTAVILVSCGQGTSEKKVNSKDEDNWETGHGELLSQIGDVQENENTVQFPDTEDLWKVTEYNAPTGKWFLENGEGQLGYGLAMGIKRPNDDFEVRLFAHEEDGVTMDRDIRIQLTKRESLKEIEETIVDDFVYVETVFEDEQIYVNALPNEENVAYILTVEVLNQKGEVEDTRISYIYVPSEELNAAIKTDKNNYANSDSELTLILENYGPTYLFFGKSYTVEKKVKGIWKTVPLELAFEDIGLNLSVNKTFEQQVSIEELDSGTYRVVKDIQASNMELSATLAAEFTIE
ncbi:immunoglobulin-like domain-containing protein [Ornithinibacillus halophilus]|uniref:Bacterial Ig-like domain-containing protein n=1 Tax=Ornithinibacillus halophilus TaxID=930117 RepID=A0A1M5IJF2_9BACI|nr:immunoglobulin-like domain-containing protein [Ornithinibacillus halophilus]SHG28395.1 hypothetical protein SAMN05216225_102442 [Ornithinibacillus halophilus]